MQGSAFRSASQAFFSFAAPLVSLTESMADLVFIRISYFGALRPGDEAHLSITREASSILRAR